MIKDKLAKETDRATKSAKLNIDFGKPAQAKLPARKEITKTKSACETVFKLDRESLLPSIVVKVAKPAVLKEERKLVKASPTKCVSKVFGPIDSIPLPTPNKERL